MSPCVKCTLPMSLVDDGEGGTAEVCSECDVPTREQLESAGMVPANAAGTLVRQAGARPRRVFTPEEI
jgi:hypothetical protein